MRKPLDLMPGEHMVVSAHPHWWYFWRHAISWLGTLVLLWLGYFGPSWLQGSCRLLGWLSAAVLAVATVIRYLQWRTTQFAITDRRVAYQAGLVSRRGVSIPLNRINNVNFRQGVVERMLGNGDLVIESAGETGESVFSNIPDPEGVRRTVFSQMDADQQSDTQQNATAIADALGRSAQAGADAAPAGTSVPERLAQLEQLRQQGLVSADEYETKRAEILGQL
jgi:uncharacterized membrane protein YdbT with pleckstrin-like domain